MTFAWGCSATSFPGDPASSGTRDVPFIDTYNFDFFIGAQSRGSKGGRDVSGNLRIFSAADLANLLSAANVSTKITGGVVSGVALFDVFPLAGVEIDVLDMEGNHIPDVFYNGLGGVPDFVAENGTADTGTFTVFNVPPGVTFIRATGGGRGVGHLWAYDQAISVMPVETIPVIVSEIGTVGAIVDAVTLINVFPVSMAIAGMQSDRRYSNDQGLLQVTPLVGFRVILPANGFFLTKMDAEGYVTNYQEMDTLLEELNGAPDLTRFPLMVSEDTISKWHEDAGVSRIPGTGTIYGQFFSGVDNASIHNRYRAFDFDGNPVGVWMYGKETLYPLSSPERRFQSSFVALNIPLGPVFLRGSGTTQVSGFTEPRAGADTVDVFADSASITEVNIFSAGVPNELAVTPLTDMTGVVTLSDQVTLATQVAIDVGGYDPALIRPRTSYGASSYRINAINRSASEAAYDYNTSILPTNSHFIFRVGNREGGSRYVDTYQNVHTNGAARVQGRLSVSRDLIVYTRAEIESMAAVAGVTIDPNKGILVGRVLNSANLATAEGIKIQTYSADGSQAGEVRYMDAVGLPQRIDTTSITGEYVVFNVPPGMVQVHVISEQDTGSRMARAFTGGVTLVTPLLAGDAPPEKVNVKGTVADLDGTLLAGAEMTFHGQLASDVAANSGFLNHFSDIGGNFNVDLGIGGKFIVSVDGGAPYYKTYNFGLETLIDPQVGNEVLGISRARIDAIAAAAPGGAVTIDPTKGIVLGEVRLQTWTDDAAVRKTVTEDISAPRAVATAFLNGDAHIDLIVANSGSDTVSVYYGLGDGTFKFGGSYPVGLTPVDLLGMDVNADGVGDILVLNQGSADVTVLLGTPRGVYREDSNLRLLVGSNPVQISRGDMDADGSRDDIVVLNRGAATLSIFMRNDNHVFVEAPYSPFGLVGTLPSGMDVQNIHPVDPDLLLSGEELAWHDDVTVAMEGSDRIETYQNGGDGLFPASELPLLVGSRPVSVLRYDVDLDGDITVDPDLEYIILNSGAGQNNVQIISVDNTSGSAQELGPPVQLDPGCGPTGMRLNDVSRDGYIDLVVMCGDNNTVTTYIGDGSGGFQPWQCESGCRRPALFPGSSPSDVVSGYFDQGDGIDLVVTNEFSNSIVVYLADNLPLGGVDMDVRYLGGAQVQDFFFLDAAGNPTTSATSGSTGRFIAFNVDPGNVWLTATAGDNGNARVVAFAGAVSNINMSIFPASPEFITLQGQVTDAVGSPQSGISIDFGSLGVTSDTQDELAISGVYDAQLQSNQPQTVVRVRQQDSAF
ncbi:MAG: FG-GAP repeat domain-containing protein [Leptospirillia bacterium]